MQIPDTGKLARASTIVLLAGLLLSACGQYGDLYLPTPEAAPAGEADAIDGEQSLPEPEQQKDVKEDEDS